MMLNVTNLPNPKLAFSNRVYITKKSFDSLAGKGFKETNDPVINISIKNTDLVFMASPITGINDNEIAMNSQQRKCGSFTLAQELNCFLFTPTSNEALCGITITCDVFAKKPGAKVVLDNKELTSSFISQFGSQVFCARQSLAMDFAGTKLDLCVEGFEHISLDGSTAAIPSSRSSSIRGQVLKGQTNITFKKPTGSPTNIIFEGAEGPQRNDSLFRSDFNFEQMGIGGLDEQFKKMFRTAFASRIFPGLVKQLGINHIRGMLLYGPPGCGKTLIARQIGKVLNAREPKIINGPEVLDKFVGGSEQKIRDLFADAEKEQAEMGDQSMLHIIIFDEMDAIMKSRGSTNDSSGVSDSIVNQLLSKIDGVDSLNNILIIGMTNRKDMIDEAILRPGRLEIHIEITLPSEAGRVQILNIKTLDMKKNGRINPEVLDRLPELARMTKNYTGAELEGMVRNAASFALARNIDAASIKALDTNAIRVEWNDFERAISETVSAFGNKDNEEIVSHYNNGICNYGVSFDETWSTLQRFVNQTRQSVRTPLLTILLEGAVASGKTAIASKLAAESDFPFIRMLSPDNMIGHSDSTRCGTLLKVFTDAYKSTMSIIFINDIERIIEYTPVGQRFSNSVLQTLLILLKKVPPSPCRLLVVATTSISHLLEDLQLTQAFNHVSHVSLLQNSSEYFNVLTEYGTGLSSKTIKSIADALHDKPIAIKQLLMILEMVRAEHMEDLGSITAEDFLACLQQVGF